MCIDRVQAADLLHSGGELQTQLDDPVLDRGEVTDASQRCPDRREQIRYNPYQRGAPVGMASVPINLIREPCPMSL